MTIKEMDIEEISITCDVKRERLAVLYKALDHAHECETMLLLRIRKGNFKNEKEKRIVRHDYNEQQYQRRKIEKEIQSIQEVL